MRSIFLSKLASVAAALAALALLAGPAAADRDTVRNGKSWSIQLQGNGSALSKKNADVAVLDPDEVKNPGKLKRKANGGKRAVLAYVSIGEAENFRSDVKKSSKKWMTNREQGWAGNKIVNYWDPEWKAIVKKRVRKALDAGYDGVYLDRVDTYERNGSRKEMIKLVKEVAAEARAKKKNAAIAVQNAEELLDDGSYVDAIDAVAKEDLYHGVNHDGRRNSKDGVKWSTNYLKKAKNKGKGVYVIEYVDGKTAAALKSEARKSGFAVTSTKNRNITGATDD